MLLKKHISAKKWETILLLVPIQDAIDQAKVKSKQGCVYGFYANGSSEKPDFVVVDGDVYRREPTPEEVKDVL